jgi:Mg-chelatase subunit ChlI
MMQHIRIETPTTLKAALAQLEVDDSLSGATKAQRRTRMLQRLLALEGQATVVESAILDAGSALAATAAATVAEAPAHRTRRRKPARSEETPEAPTIPSGKSKAGKDKAPTASAGKGGKSKTEGKAAAPVETETEKNRAGRGGVAGLTGREVRVLTMLANEGSTEKSRLKKECGSGSAVLGAVNREGFGVRGGGLAGKGLIIGSRKEGEPETVYSITPAGRKALAQVRRKLAGK